MCFVRPIDSCGVGWRKGCSDCSTLKLTTPILLRLLVIRSNGLETRSETLRYYGVILMEQVPIFQDERIKIETPEANLWWAVIDQAIEDLLDPDLNESTIMWFTSASDQPATFLWICVHLDLDASAVRAALKQRISRKDPAKPFTSAAA